MDGASRPVGKSQARLRQTRDIIKGGGSMKRRKRTTVWAYLDGKKLVDVLQAALDNNMMVADMKAMLVRENPGHDVTFKTE